MSTTLEVLLKEKDTAIIVRDVEADPDSALVSYDDLAPGTVPDFSSGISGIVFDHLVTSGEVQKP